MLLSTKPAAGNTAMMPFVFTTQQPQLCCQRQSAYATANIPGDAVAGVEYTSATGTPVLLHAGQTSVTVDVPVLHDNIYNPNLSL